MGFLFYYTHSNDQEIYPNNKNLINLNHIEQGNYILHIKDKEGNQIEAKSFVKIR